jgi:hypothetical protein
MENVKLTIRSLDVSKINKPECIKINTNEVYFPLALKVVLPGMCPTRNATFSQLK